PSAPPARPGPLASPPVYTFPAWIAPPKTLPYDDGEPIPSGYTLKTRLHRPLIVAGSITFGTAYLISLLGGALAAGGDEGSSFTPLFVPCVGPFIALGTVKTDDVGQFWLTLDGLTQSAGAAMLVAGLLIDQKYLQHTSTTPSALLRPALSVGPGSTRFTWRF
ncbi:MAG: hypothetical protein ABI193_20690, partial [Minicystis sp.]